MRENRTKRDLEFKEIGEFEDIVKKVKSKERKIIDEPIEKQIYFDDRQYSCKIPKEIMDSIGYKKGDKLSFTLIRVPSKEKITVEIKYVRG